jgi:hypothetical protein
MAIIIKNIKATAITAASIKKRWVLILSNMDAVRESPKGSAIAEAALYIRAMAAILIKGIRIKPKIIRTPNILKACFNITTYPAATATSRVLEYG